MTIEGLGKKFQDARIARGLTLDEAARLTKIRPSRLAEIEADDFSQFPSLAYAKGFLQIYGKLLDVDVTPYLDVFETPQQMTVDGYSYLQDQPAPKPRRIRPSRPAVVRHRPRASGGDRKSPFGLLIAIGVIVLGFILMRLIMNIQRISPHQMVGVPEQTQTQAQPQAQNQTQAPPAQAPVAQKPAALAPPTQSVAPTPPPSAVAEAPKKAAPTAATSATSVAPAATIPPAFANVSASAKVNPAPTATKEPTKEPEVRRAEPVRPEDLAKAGVTPKTVEMEGPNKIAIKPLKKTYIKVVVDDGAKQASFERWISPSDGTMEFHGQKIAVRVLDRDAIRISKNGKPVGEDDEDVTVE